MAHHAAKAPDGGQDVTDNLPIIALTTGDPAGIGPEICLKAATAPEVRQVCRPVLFGDLSAVQTHIDGGGLDCTITGYDHVDSVDWDVETVPVVALDHFGNQPVALGEINADNGRAQFDSGVQAVRAALAGKAAAVVAAPNTKSSINLAGIEYEGYASLLSQEFGTPPEDIFLMLSFGKTNIAHCTLHTSVRKALELITRPRVEAVIRAVHDTLVATGAADPLIMVSGVNPHASEGGLMGDEEAEIIIPVLEHLRTAGIRIEGPAPADLMLQREDVDAFVMMLHDQGHVPAKLLARHGSAGVIIGTPIRFSSVGHGTALDIAGQGKANPAAMIEAVKWMTGSA